MFLVMPVPLRIACPQCGQLLYHKRAGRCTACGAPVSAHVEETRKREERIEKILALVGTGLVLGVFLLSGGIGLFEGLAMYAIAGAALFYVAKKTFTPNRPPKD